MARLSIARTLILALTLAAVPAAALAQFAPSDAAEFIGVWTVTLDSPQGSFEQEVTVKAAGDFQGNAFDARIVMSPTGDDTASVLFGINGGQFSMNGAGTRKK